MLHTRRHRKILRKDCQNGNFTTLHKVVKGFKFWEKLFSASWPITTSRTDCSGDPTTHGRSWWEAAADGIGIWPNLSFGEHCYMPFVALSRGGEHSWQCFFYSKSTMSESTLKAALCFIWHTGRGRWKPPFSRRFRGVLHPTPSFFIPTLCKRSSERNECENVLSYTHLYPRLWLCGVYKTVWDDMNNRIEIAKSKIHTHVFSLHLHSEMVQASFHLTVPSLTMPILQLCGLRPYFIWPSPSDLGGEQPCLYLFQMATLEGGVKRLPPWGGGGGVCVCLVFVISMWR